MFILIRKCFYALAFFFCLATIRANILREHIFVHAVFYTYDVEMWKIHEFSVDMHTA